MSSSVISLAILAALFVAIGAKNEKKLPAAKVTFKGGKQVVQHFDNEEMKKKTGHNMLFDGFVVESVLDPALAKQEKDNFVAISHQKVLKLTPEQKTHVEMKRLEKANLMSLEKTKEETQSVKSLKKRSSSHMLSDHDHEDAPTEIYYHQPGSYIEYSSCGSSHEPGSFGLEADKCFRCVKHDTGETRGCKATYDWMHNMVNFTSYESLTCDDAYYWMDKVTNTWPVDECYAGYHRWTYVGWSNAYADPHSGSFYDAFYNNSNAYCDEAPFFYYKVPGGTCIGDDHQGVSHRLTQGCEYMLEYKNDHCGQEPFEIWPMRNRINKCALDDEGDRRLPFLGLFQQHHEIPVDSPSRHAFFCGLGQPENHEIECVNEDGLPCHDINEYDGFVGIPSPSAHICKPHDNDDELRVQFAHLARNNDTGRGMIKLTINTPDDVSSTDRFRIVFKLFDKFSGQKEHFGSFKFNGRPGNNTLTFQTEGLFMPTIEAREMAIKIKQRVYDEDRAFVRKSCVRFAFPGDDEDGEHNDHQDGVVFDTTGCCTCPPEYVGHQAWIDNGVCWTGKPEPACEMADCHGKSYRWYPYMDSGDYTVECFECRRNAMCQNNCAGHEQPIHAPTHDPNDHQDGVVFDTTGCCTCPPEYDGHQAWIDNDVCWTGKPDPACEMADCHDKSYTWYPYMDSGDYSVECFECRRNAMCQNNCSPGGDHGSTGADAPLMDGM